MGPLDSVNSGPRTKSRHRNITGFKQNLPAVALVLTVVENCGPKPVVAGIIFHLSNFQRCATSVFYSLFVTTNLLSQVR